jgi:hypothetical protein
MAAAFILVSPDDFVFVDFPAGRRIVRPERDPRDGTNWFHPIFDPI